VEIKALFSILVKHLDQAVIAKELLHRLDLPDMGRNPLKLDVDKKREGATAGGEGLTAPTPDVQTNGGRDERPSFIIDLTSQFFSGEEDDEAIWRSTSDVERICLEIKSQSERVRDFCGAAGVITPHDRDDLGTPEFILRMSDACRPPDDPHWPCGVHRVRGSLFQQWQGRTTVFESAAIRQRRKATTSV